MSDNSAHVRAEAMTGWISRALHGDPGEPAPNVNDPNVLRDYLHERLRPTEAGAAAQAVATAPVAEPDFADDAKARAWAILNPDQRAAVASGDPDVVEHFETLAEIYRGDAGE